MALAVQRANEQPGLGARRRDREIEAAMAVAVTSRVAQFFHINCRQWLSLPAMLPHALAPCAANAPRSPLCVFLCVFLLRQQSDGFRTAVARNPIGFLRREQYHNPTEKDSEIVD